MKNEVIGQYRTVSLLTTLSWAVANPVLFVFYLSKGLTVAEAGLVVAAYSFAVVLFEIPTGAFADAYGRTKSGAVSFILLIAGYAAMIFAPGMWMMLAVFIVGIADSFMSGAIDAWAVDRLKDRKEKHLTINLFAAGRVASIAALLGGGIIGGIIGSYSMVATLIIGLPICAFGAYYCLRLPEKEPKKRFGAVEKRIMDELSRAWKHCTKNANLRALLSIAFLLGLATYFLFAFWQPAFQQLFGWGTFEFGFLFAGMMVASLIGNLIGEKYGKQRLFYAIALALSGAFAFLAGWAWAPLASLLLYLLFELFIGMQNPTEGKLLHDNANSAQRATIASMKSLTFRLGFGLGGILFFLFASGNIAGSWMASGALLAVAAAIAWKMGF